MAWIHILVYFVCVPWSRLSRLAFWALILLRRCHRYSRFGFVYHLQRRRVGSRSPEWSRRPGRNCRYDLRKKWHIRNLNQVNNCYYVFSKHILSVLCWFFPNIFFPFWVVKLANIFLQNIKKLIFFLPIAHQNPNVRVRSFMSLVISCLKIIYHFTFSKKYAF